MSKKVLVENKDKNDHSQFLNDDDMAKLTDLFKKIKKNDEFEFIFFSKKGKYLPQEKYMSLLKFFNTRKNVKIIKPSDTLDISYTPTKDTTYRCSIEDTKNINKLMKKLNMLRNHVVFRTLLSFWKDDQQLKEKKHPGIDLLKKEKDASEVVEINDYDMRARLSKESKISSKEVNELINIDEKAMGNIIFRYKQRTSVYIHGDENSDDFIRIDLTYVRMNDTFEKLNRSVPNYELEIEYGTKTSPNKESLTKMINEAQLLLKIIQNSNYIISNSTITDVHNFYKSLFMIEKEGTVTSLEGRQPVTLEIQHATENLANKYAVTDKADGDRHFSIIFDQKVYLMNSNGGVKATGIKLNSSLKDYNGSVMDGELIFIPEENRHIYLAFDCLFHKGIDVRPTIKLFDRLAKADDIVNNCFIFGKQKGFTPNPKGTSIENLDKKIEFHFNEMKDAIETLNHDIKIDKQFVLIRRKYFVGAAGAYDWEIFSYASSMWNAFTKTSEIKCPYFLDGLIFQPLEQAYVNASESKFQDYKWKPPEKNSIDCYIEFEKDKDGKVQTIYDNSYDDFLRNKPYRICRLFAGQKIGQNLAPVLLFKDDIEKSSAYLFLDDGEVRDAEGEILSDKTVVEFYFNNDPELLEQFKWVPLRTRHDKTESSLRYGKNFGNYITVAQKVWRSIVNPVLMTDFDDLSRGNNPAKNNYTYDKKLQAMRKLIGHELIASASKENAYFQKNKSYIAESMKQFHNWIKSNLIYTYCNPMYQNNKQLSVFDIGCGRGGDNMKFYHALIAFYVGIDPDREGLIGAVNGAISRYNKEKARRPNFPKMYFIQADATAKLDLPSQKNALNVRKLENEEFFTQFFSDDKKGKTLFDIINCQFAVHYMLKNSDSWSNFKTNVNNHLRNGGMFLATTFDAEKILKLLGDKDSYVKEYIDSNGKVQILFEIRKKFTMKIDPKTILGPGNGIEVYMSWLSEEGRFLTEYLVDPRFFVKDLLDECGLELIDTDSFENQLAIHEPFITHYVKYEEGDETRQFTEKVSKFYQRSSQNDGAKVWNGLFRYYVFRKKQVSKQAGGSNDNVIDFSNPTLFSIPDMKKYDNEYSCINSLHHILKNHKVIPKIDPEKLCKDINIKFKRDNDIDLADLSKNIIIEHSLENGATEHILNGVNIFIVERDCNDIYDIDLIQKHKKINDAVILMKEGLLYVPVYYIDPETQKKVGIFEMSHPIIQQMLQEV